MGEVLSYAYILPGFNHAGGGGGGKATRNLRAYAPRIRAHK